MMMYFIILKLEHYFQCPCCLAETSMLIDFSIPTQQYIEDFGICCNPIEVGVAVEENEIVSFEAKSIER